VRSGGGGGITQHIDAHLLHDLDCHPLRRVYSNFLDWIKKR
jgi:hypothetical protein